MTRFLVLLLSVLSCAAATLPNVLHVQSSIPYRFNPVAYYSPNSPLNTLNGAGMSNLKNLAPDIPSVAGYNRDLAQSTAASQPLLTNLVNGMLCLEFDGVDDYLKTATFPFVQPETVIGVFEQLTWASNVRLFDGFGVLGGALSQAGASPNLYLYAGNTVGPLTTVALGNPACVTVVVNGVSSSVAAGNGTPVSGDAGASNMDGLTLAALGGVYSQNSNIRTSDLFLFDRVLTASEQSCLVQWLGRRNGVNVW